VEVSELLAELIEQVAVEARSSEFVDVKSGVSARLTISAYENLVSQSYRRLLLSGEKKTLARLADLYMVVPAINGKIELVYEGEQEGSVNVARALIGSSIRTLSAKYFKNLEKKKKLKKEGVEDSAYGEILNWFAENPKGLEVMHSDGDKEYKKKLLAVSGLEQAVLKQIPDLKGNDYRFVFMEFLLHGLAQFSQLDAKLVAGVGFQFNDIINGYFNFGEGDLLN
ncbi:MAG: magnesium chelatase, partial [Luteibaculum sp.]